MQKSSRPRFRDLGLGFGFGVWVLGSWEGPPSTGLLTGLGLGQGFIGAWDKGYLLGFRWMII